MQFYFFILKSHGFSIKINDLIFKSFKFKYLLINILLKHLNDGMSIMFMCGQRKVGEVNFTGKPCINIHIK